MFRKTALGAQLVVAAALVFSSATGAHAQSCGNGNVQPSQGEFCDNGGANNTQAVGCCAAGCTAFVTAGTTCRPDAGICDNGAETCSGSSAACPADSFASSATVCRPGASICDAAENCTGSSGTCPADILSASTTLCRASLGVCDPAENCTGASANCPGDLKSTSVCRPDSGQCDNGTETCDGTNNACPADSAATAGTLCRVAAGQCDLAESCDGTSSTCPNDVKRTTLCRASVGDCDAAESCDGVGNNCPADAKSTSVCRPAAGVCDDAESCNGSANFCPPDEKSTAVCRPDSGVCDAGQEVCDGSNDDCPADNPINEGTLCRTSTGICDPSESCDGTNGACPADAKSTSVCRASGGDCDLAESCDGTNGACPVDAKSTDVCRPVANPLCDVAESCDGTNDACPDDDLLNCEDDDGEICTEAMCDPIEGCILADACVEICRGPGFWQTHSGNEKGINIGQAVLDDAGPFEVCGQVISNTTELGTLASSLEGFCVRTQGVKQRQLYRVLLTTRFNCAISEGGTCDEILEDFIDVSFSDCSALCAGDPVPDGPTLEECKHQLGCFNGGGRIIDGECAKGTCEGDPETFCGGDFEECENEADCVAFEDSCANVPLCSEDLDAEAEICPKAGAASSPKTCRDARKNECTIDECVIDSD